MSYSTNPQHHSKSGTLRPLRLAASSVLSVFALLGAQLADAGAIVVGRSGPTNGCTVPTIQAAINRANGFGGHNLILVTDDVADGVHHERLNLRNLRSGLQLELVGGFNNCSDLQPTASGKASIYGGSANTPVVSIEGAINLRMRGFWIEGGNNGIDWDGRGLVELANLTINNNSQRGFEVRGNGYSHAALIGDVVISNNRGVGIFIDQTGGDSQALLTIKGSGNSIRQNLSSGIYLSSDATLEIGASGDVLFGNGGYGLEVYQSQQQEIAASFIYSTNPTDPLAISNNTRGAIRMRTDVPAAPLCLRNVAFRSNGARAIYAEGASSRIEMNGNDCEFPETAHVQCDGITYLSCNTFYDNGAASTPLVNIVDGARVELNRVLFYRNRGSSLLSTNLGADASSAGITMTRSVVLENVVRDNLFEALNGGFVDIWDTTVRLNTGGFLLSLVGIEPGLLQLTNTIIDQPQTLLSNTGLASNVKLNRVLAPNEVGAEQIPRAMLIGRPTYRDDIGRLSVYSLGVDYAPAGGGVDRDRNPRDVDTTDIPNGSGPRDLGAFEVQATATDRIFAGRFEPEINQ